MSYNWVKTERKYFLWLIFRGIHFQRQYSVKVWQGNSKLLHIKLPGIRKHFTFLKNSSGPLLLFKVWVQISGIKKLTIIWVLFEDEGCKTHLPQNLWVKNQTSGKYMGTAAPMLTRSLLIFSTNLHLDSTKPVYSKRFTFH